MEKPKTNTDHHNGDLNLLKTNKGFTHFKWLTFKELLNSNLLNWINNIACNVATIFLIK